MERPFDGTRVAAAGDAGPPGARRRCRRRRRPPLLLLVGPAGGFEPRRPSVLAGRGLPAASLGPRILRAETAAVAAVAIAQARGGTSPGSLMRPATFASCPSGAIRPAPGARDDGDVGEVLHRAAARDVVHGLVEALEDRADRAGAAEPLGDLVGDVARVEVGEDEDVGAGPPIGLSGALLLRRPRAGSRRRTASRRRRGASARPARTRRRPPSPGRSRRPWRCRGWRRRGKRRAARGRRRARSRRSRGRSRRASPRRAR